MILGIIASSISSTSATPTYGIAQATYDNLTYAASGYTGVAYKFDIKNGKLFFSTDSNLYRYTHTAEAINSLSYDTNTVAHAATMHGINIISAGTVMLNETETEWVYERTMSTAYDLTTDANENSTQYTAQGTNMRDTWVNEAGTQAWRLDGTSGIVYRYTLDPAYASEGWTYDTVSIDTSTETAGPRGIAVSPDGVTMLVVDYTNNYVYEYDISSGDYVTGLDISDQTTVAYGICYEEDGSKFYVLDTSGNFWQYNVVNTNEFQVEYDALLTRAGVQGYTTPSAAQQILQNQLVVDLKQNGIWAEQDLIYVPANDGSEDFAKLNWKSPSTFELTKSGTVTWTSNEGWEGDGSTGYLDTGWDAQTNASNFTSSNGSASIWVFSQQTEVTDNTYHYFFGGSRYTGDSNVKIGMGDYSDDRITYTCCDGAIHIDPGLSTGGYTGLNTVSMDSTDTGSEVKYHQSATLADFRSGTPIAFDHAYDVAILCDNYLDTKKEFSDIAFSFFCIGSEQTSLISAKNTAISNYMTGL